MKAHAQNTDVDAAQTRGVRAFLDAHPAGIGIFMTAVLLLLGLTAYRALRTPVNFTWYYDMEDGKLVAVRDDGVASLGPTLVHARVFACGRCPSVPGTASYLESWTPEAIAAQKAIATRSDPDAGPVRPGKHHTGESRSDLAAIATGHLIAKPDKAPAWFVMGSREARAIIDESTRCEDHAVAVECRP